jgi:glucose/arabinose dehydrogenase
MKTALGAAASYIGWPSEPVNAAATDPDAGPQIVGRSVPAIEKSGLAAELVDCCQLPKRAGGWRVANINHTFHDYKDPDYVYTADGTGVIYKVRLTDGSAHKFFDLAKACGGFFQNSYLFDGLRSFAFHPNFHRRQIGNGRLYTVHTETISSPTPAGSRLFTGPFTPQYYICVLTEWQVYASDRNRVNPSTRRELFRSTVWNKEHPMDQVIFNPNLSPEHPDYWYMFVSVGDGGNGVSKRPDAIFKMAQDPALIHGKILRINPIPKTAGQRYGIPSSNPFYKRSGWNKMIWATGLRHPQVMCFDTVGRKEMLLSSIGQNLVETVYCGRPGANFGWPYRAGTFVTDRNDSNRLYGLPAPAVDSMRGYTYPCAQFSHQDGIAVAGGYVYRSHYLPALHGHYLCGDIASGRIFHFSVDDWVAGTTATLKELTLVRDGRPIALRDYLGGRVDLRFGQTLDGDVLVTSKRAGRIWKLRPTT